MSKVRVSGDIPAPVGEVWAVVGEDARGHDLNPLGSTTFR